MPQMATIYWLFMFFFSVLWVLLLFWMYNQVMKPFSKINFMSEQQNKSKSWKKYN